MLEVQNICFLPSLICFVHEQFPEKKQLPLHQMDPFAVWYEERTLFSCFSQLEFSNLY